MAAASNAGYLLRVGPYREAVAAERLVADVVGGDLVLEIGPEEVVLRVADRTVVVVGPRLILSRRGRRREVRREVALGPARLHLARGWPGRELALWLEERPGVIERIWGVEPRPTLDDGGLEAGRGLDRLAIRLAEVVGGRGVPAVEVGHGGHRVVLLDHVDRLVVHARPLFRERPRRCFEVCADGSMIVVARGGERRARFRTRFDVVTGGDRIRFVGEHGDDVAGLYLPWIAPEDRAELARRFADLVDPAPPDVGRAVARAGGPVRGGTLTARLATSWPLPGSRLAR